jgi:hypothetical protein
MASGDQAPIFIGVPSLEWIIQPQIRLPMPSAFSSLPVSTPMTPGIAFAAVTSIDVISACACGLRTNAACFIPGTTMSST